MNPEFAANPTTTSTTTTSQSNYAPNSSYPMNNAPSYPNNAYPMSNYPVAPAPGRGKKLKPYRNRPSKAQALLEILSFCLLLASAPAFLGGTLSIFVFYFALILGFMGLFAWTRRHSVMLSLLAFCLIILCIVNIVLRSQDKANCMPYFYYSNIFGAAAVVPVVLPSQPTNSTNNNSTVLPIPTPIPQPVNQTANITADTIRLEADNVFGNLVNSGRGSFDNDDDDGTYNDSIWCGGKKIVYITHAIIIALAIPIMLLALCLLRQKRRSNVPVVQQTNQTTTVRRSVVEA